MGRDGEGGMITFYIKKIPRKMFDVYTKFLCYRKIIICWINTKCLPPCITRADSTKSD